GPGGPRHRGLGPRPPPRDHRAALRDRAQRCRVAGCRLPQALRRPPARARRGTAADDPALPRPHAFERARPRVAAPVSLRQVDGPPGPPWDRPLQGRLDRVVVESELLADNPLGDPARRPLYVYNSPGADGSDGVPAVYVIQ